MTVHHPVHTSSRTRLIARVLGPFFTVVAVVAVIRSSDMPQMLSEFSESTVWPWVTGTFILFGGIAIVALHQQWRDPAAIIVSILGWMLVVRGMVLIAVPDLFDGIARRMVDAPATWIPLFGALAVIGLYLSYEGWRPAQHPSDVA